MSRRIRVTRGDLVESEHRVHAVVAGPEGRELRWGEATLPTTLRSAAKLFQALPLVEDGVADALPLSDEELVLCCASHNTEAAHVEAARGILAKAGLDEGALACGPHRPLEPSAARALDAAGVEPTAIHNNCSGKHAGMLALAVHHGWDPEGYHRPDHPVQRRMAAEISRWSGVDEDAIPTGVDGCGIPCFGLPLERVADAFRRFGAGEADGPGRLLDAIGRAPFMIGGTGRLCSRLPEVTGGRIVAKIGAEGVYGAIVRDAGLGVAVKVEDGGRRAVEPALVAVLAELGVLSPPELEALEDHRAQAVTNTRGEVVGRIAFVDAASWTGASPAALADASPGPEGSAGPEPSSGTGASDDIQWDRGLEAIVRLSGALAGGGEAELEAALRIAARDADPVEVEEALLQSYLFLGFPAALNAFAAWRRVSGADAPEMADASSAPDDDSADVGGSDRGGSAAFRLRGERTCRRVYGSAYAALRRNIDRLKPELDRWMVVEGYGKVLSRSGLSLGRRECCIAAILAVVGAPVQLRSHMRGALRCGATPEELDRILNLVEPYMGASARNEAYSVRDAVATAAEE